MTSLTEVYQGTEREVTSLRRLYAGTILVCTGAILAVVAVLLSTTELFSGYVADQFAAIQYAGVLAGVGVPAALVGVFIVLPASRRLKAAAAISASLCLLGVVLFWYAYPEHWRGYGENLTLHVSVVYLLGLFTALWCLFVAIVNFKTRNDPGGMLEMNVTRQGETKIVEVENSSGGFSGVGLFGSDPDGDVKTQTNVVSETNAESGSKTVSSTRTPSDSRSRPSNPLESSRSVPSSDGGSESTGIRSPEGSGDGRDAELVDGPEPEQPTTVEPTDQYCGNCRHFNYVRSSSGIVPYCGYHDGTMQDMDACEEWTPNRRDPSRPER